MKKSILNLGKALNKVEQKTINGGFGPIRYCRNIGSLCDPMHICEFRGPGLLGVCVSVDLQ
ncbi:hypothetical protein [uncultured Tenacibaculum sp.]|uniref:hypothetical protein n=1 Tax=uncultured Tenacibaculum sp. TaxID=174713 RepID=UPI002612E2D4|nr:hypothetical protein [uncultured Tenacibaculum sp.]